MLGVPGAGFFMAGIKTIDYLLLPAAVIVTPSDQQTKGNEMAYKARITKSADQSFYALIVRVDSDGQENVIHGYKGRHFASLKAAEKSTAAYIAKCF